MSAPGGTSAEYSVGLFAAALGGQRAWPATRACSAAEDSRRFRQLI
jgi:hypothetical protein